MNIWKKEEELERKSKEFKKRTTIPREKNNNPPGKEQRISKKKGWKWFVICVKKTILISTKRKKFRKIIPLRFSNFAEFFLGDCLSF